MTDFDETIRRVPALIARVRELDAAATKGPWSSHPPVSPYKDGRWSVCDDRTNTLARVNVGIRVPGVERQDAALIAYYRTACPQLAVECERLRERVRVLEEALRAIVAPDDGCQFSYGAGCDHSCRATARAALAKGGE